MSGAVAAVCVAVAVAVVFFGLMWFISDHGGTPPCQTFWDAQWTGYKIVDGQRVRCFKGDVVEVRP